MITASDSIDKHNPNPKTKKIQNDKTPPRQNQIIAEMQKTLEEASMVTETKGTDIRSKICNELMQEWEKLPDKEAKKNQPNNTEDKEHHNKEKTHKTNNYQALQCQEWHDREE